MRSRYIFLILIFLIIFCAVFSMIFLKNQSEFEEKKEKILMTSKTHEAFKEDNNKEWVYAKGKKNKILPYINIKNKKISKLNNSIKNDKKVKSSSYLYSINGDLLSILFTKNYENNKEYETYNINLGNTKVISGMDVLKYINADISNIQKITTSTISYELSKYKNDSDKYQLYYNKTIEAFSNEIINNTLKVYIGSNKEIIIFVTIYTDENYIKAINIVDK